jgi:hypothetical protein
MSSPVIPASSCWGSPVILTSSWSSPVILTSSCWSSPVILTSLCWTGEEGSAGGFLVARHDEAPRNDGTRRHP